jgi:hypothetical protein
MDRNYTEEIRKNVKAALEEAYQKLNDAANEMDRMNEEDAWQDVDKIIKVRKQVLALLNVELSHI